MITSLDNNNNNNMEHFAKWEHFAKFRGEKLTSVIVEVPVKKYVLKFQSYNLICVRLLNVFAALNDQYDESLCFHTLFSLKMELLDFRCCSSVGELASVC